MNVVCYSILFLSLPVLGKVKLTMVDNLEVYLGDSASIPCHYSFTDIEKEPSFFMIQWFVVSKLKKKNLHCLSETNHS